MRKISGSRAGLAAATLGMLLCAMVPAPWARAQDTAQPVGKPSKAPGLFASETPLSMTISAPWRVFMRKKERLSGYPATLAYTDDSGAARSMALTVEARGITRLKVCKFPPVKLVFDKEAIKGTPFRGNKSLKLVTHCGNGERWEQYPVREMLAYRIYNLVTERSFRVRPLTVTYVDSDDRSTDGPHFGFLIEDDSALARRNDLEKLDIPKPRLAQLDPLENNRFALFQFLIGNTDWAVLSGPSDDRCCHNSELIGPKSGATVYAVPYDFDSSGLVDAHYAAPNPSLPIRSNTERLFRGFCAYQATLGAARREFLQHRAQIMDLVREEKRLSARSSNAVQSYLGKGLDILADDEEFAANVMAKCRK